MEHRSFTPQGAGSTGQNTFDVAGESFRVRSNIPGSAILDYYTAFGIADDRVQAMETWNLLRAALAHDCENCNATGKIDDNGEVIECAVCRGTGLTPAEFNRFREYVDDPRHGVHLTDLLAIAQWLAVEYGRIPTQPASASQPGSATENDGSEGTSS